MAKKNESIPVFSKEQISFLSSLCPDLDFNHMDMFSSDDWIRIEDAVGDELWSHGLETVVKNGKEDYVANEIGVMCYSILDNEDL